MEAPALNDISARLKEYRQQLAAHQKQLEDFELRLERFRQRQRDFQVQLKILHKENEYLNTLRQEWERKYQERCGQGSGSE